MKFSISQKIFYRRYKKKFYELIFFPRRRKKISFFLDIINANIERLHVLRHISPTCTEFNINTVEVGLYAHHFWAY